MTLGGSQHGNADQQFTANGANSANSANYGKSADRANSVYLRGTGGWALSAVTAMCKPVGHAHVHEHALKAHEASPALSTEQREARITTEGERESNFILCSLIYLHRI